MAQADEIPGVWGQRIPSEQWEGEGLLPQVPHSSQDLLLQGFSGASAALSWEHPSLFYPYSSRLKFLPNEENQEQTVHGCFP